MQEFRQAIRSLLKAPGFTVAAVLTLAVGIGAATTMFSVLNGVLLKPLNYSQSDRIVSVLNQYVDRTAPQLAGGDVIDIGAEHRIFDAFAYYLGGEMGVQLATRAEFVGTRLVSPDFFRVFDVAPVAGRLFNPDDAEQSAIVSAGFAQRLYGEAGAALRQTVFIENREYEIVGVMPARMQFPANTEVWAASAVQPDIRNRTGHRYRTIARLAPGVSAAAANARLSTVATQLATAFPDSNKGKSFVAVPIRENLVGQVRATLYVLMGAVAFLLLIACGNVANLLLARASSRSRELAVRVALGASRARIVGHLLVESFVLSVLASSLGLFFALGGTRAVSRLGSPLIPLPRLNDINIEWRVLLFSVGLSIVTTVLFGLAPGLQAARAAVRDTVVRGARGVLGRNSSRLRSGLIVGQITLSVALAVNAGVLIRSVFALSDVTLGYRTEGRLVMYAHAPARAASGSGANRDAYLRVGRFFNELFGDLRRLPGVVAVGGAMGLPTGQYDSGGSYAVEGQHTFDGDVSRLPTAGFRLASPRYFGTMAIPIVRGRDFGDDDRFDRPFVAIVSQSFASQSFGDEDPIGHRIMCGFDQPFTWMTIVGVTGDVRQASPATPPRAELYMPLDQHPFMANEVQVVLRSDVAPASLISSVQQTVRALNPDVAMKFTTLDESVGRSISTPRFRAMLIGTFAVLAVGLALAGMYAVMSYLTAQRTAEFGLRVALGATVADVLRLVLGSAARVTIIGLVSGCLLALATSRALAAMVFGVTTTDLVSYAAVVLVGLPTLVAAAVIPALRAARVDPMTALKTE